jgi:hypothetical protein
MARAEGKNPDLRASDAERDAVASELGQHFQDGRLDQAEFDDRLTATMAAKTRRDLDAVRTDLPPIVAPEHSWAAIEPDQEGAAAAAPWRLAQPGLTVRRPRVLALVPLLVAAALIGGLLGGGWHHGWGFAPFGFLWLIVPILAGRTWIGGGRRRQWR